MKKTLVLAAAFVAMLSSCSTAMKTARTVETTSSIENATVADLDVSPERITYKTSPSKAIQRGGMANVKRAAEAEALTANGNADVLVEPQYIIEKKKSLFGSKVTSITVTGRPAKYRNFRSLNDSVWSNPAFRGLQPVIVKKGGSTPYKFKTKQKTAAFYPNNIRRTGFSTMLELGGGYSFYDDPGGNVSTENLRATLTFGWQMTPNVFLGVGAGADYEGDLEEFFVPVFAEGRYYLSESRNSWFVGLKLGGTVPCNSDYDGGLFFAPAIGYSFGCFEVAAVYTYKTPSTNNIHGYWHYEGSSYDYNMSNIGISLGFRF